MKSGLHLLLTAALALPLTVAQAQPESFPSRPIKLVVPAPAGSGVDVAARLIASSMQNDLGAPVVIDNKPGALGQLGSTFVARSPADGYTWLLASNTTHSALPFLLKSVSFDALKDFTPMGRIGFYVFALLVNANIPANSASELAAYAAKKGSVSYGYGSAASQVASAVFVKREKLNAIPVPYKGTPLALTDLAGGQLDFMFVDWASGQPFAKGGKVRAIGALAPASVALMPGLKPIDTDSGLNTFSGWSGLVGPAGIDPKIVQKINAALNRTLEQESVKTALANNGILAAPATPAQLETFMKEQLAAWGQKIKEAGMTAE